jgi:hypothetical protein
MFVALRMGMGTGSLNSLVGLRTVLPMKPHLLFGSIMAVGAGFCVFEVATKPEGLPSPLYARRTGVAHIYDFEMGCASSVAVALFLGTSGLGSLLVRVFSLKEEPEPPECVAPGPAW